jgi:hypothetical protein
MEIPLPSAGATHSNLVNKIFSESFNKELRMIIVRAANHRQALEAV